MLTNEDRAELDRAAPDDDEVICPNCVHQFRAIPVNVQARIAELEDEKAQVAGAIKTIDEAYSQLLQRAEKAEAALRQAVPREPTEKMREIFLDSVYNQAMGRFDILLLRSVFAEAWRKACDAAPAAPGEGT